MRQTAVLAAVLMSASLSLADDGLRERIEDEHAKGADHWIYNDIAAGLKKAKQTGKPLFVTFRCVPCHDCMGFDAEVAGGSDGVKAMAAKEFVCVRQVEMKGVDLTRFQFDHDLNWAGMFLNGDGTVYARYGTQSAAGADAYNSVNGLLNTMERVLQLHANYPANRSLFAGKTGKPRAWKVATDMSTLHPNLLKGGQTTRSNCIHCHNIHDAENELWKQQGTMSHDRLWRYPLPENIGLTVDSSDGRTISDVAPGSSAAKADLKKGDRIEEFNGQAVSSIADIQWVLHHIPNEAGQTVSAKLSDGRTIALATQEDWKKTDISWRGSMWSLSPKLRIWMPPLDSFGREKNRIADDNGALLVKWINRKTEAGRAAAKAGLKQGDIVIRLNGTPVPRDNQHFNAYIKLNHKVGDRLRLTVLRGGKETDVTLPLVE